MRVQTITSRDVAACPKISLSPGHYRPDGSCLCDEREAVEAEMAALRERMAAVRERLRNC